MWRKVTERDAYLQCFSTWSHLSEVTLIALDVLHPCAYLWVGQSKQMSSEKATTGWNGKFLASWLRGSDFSGWNDSVELMAVQWPTPSLLRMAVDIHWTYLILAFSCTAGNVSSFPYSTSKMECIISLNIKYPLYGWTPKEIDPRGFWGSISSYGEGL